MVQLTALITEAFLALIVVRAAWAYIQHEKGPRNVALVHGALAVGLSGLLIEGELLLGSGPLAAVPAAALFVHAHLLLGQVGRLRPMPRVLRTGALAVAAAVLPLPWVVAGPLPGVVAGTLLAFLAGVEVLATWTFLQAIETSAGIGRGRIRLAAATTALFGAAFAAATLGTVAPASAVVAGSLMHLLALAGAVTAYLGFAPPSWLRHAWRTSEVGGFIKELSQMTPEERATDVPDRLRSEARSAVGGAAALIADSRDGGMPLEVTTPVPTGPSAFVDRDGAVGRAWFTQSPVFTDDGDPLGPREHELLDAVGASGLMAVPIASSERRRGVLVVPVDRRPLFPDDDLELLQLVAREAAVTMDGVEFSKTQMRLVEQLREVNAELKESQATLRESEERFRAVAETANDAIVSVDRGSRVTYFNRKAEQMFGYSAEKMTGEPFATLAAPEDEETLVHAVERVLETGESEFLGRTVELAGRARDGATFPIEVSLSAFSTSRGRFVTLIVRDLTEWKAAEEELRAHRERLAEMVEERTAELRRANEQLKREVSERIDVEAELRQHRERLEELVQERTAKLEEANEQLKREVRAKERVKDQLEERNRELEDFAYVVSHDLKAPLRGIRNLAHWVEEEAEGDLSPEAQEHLDLLQQRVGRMGRMIDSILEYSRVGRAAEEPEEVRVGRLLEQVVDLVQPPEGFEVHVEGEMPTLVTDRMHLQRVFQNLIQNAVEHHDRDEGVVRVSAREHDGHAIFAVEDDGPGIPPERRDEVFRIFRTLEPKDEKDSTGVGLTLVKKIVEAHGGEVDLETGGGRGTCFTVRWPLDPPGAPP